jgi:hypothetical protein
MSICSRPDNADEGWAPRIHEGQQPPGKTVPASHFFLLFCHTDYSNNSEYQPLLMIFYVIFNQQNKEKPDMTVLRILLLIAAPGAAIS